MTENALCTSRLLELEPSSASFCSALARHAAEPCCLVTLALSILAASTCVGHAEASVELLHFWSSVFPQHSSRQMLCDRA